VTSNNTLSVDQVQTITGASAIAFGVMGLMAPGALSRSYGLADASPDFRYLARMWGARTGVLGALTLAMPAGKEREKLFMAAVVMNGLDTLNVMTTKELPARTRVMAGLTSATLLAAGVYALNEGA
jgi:hypothetical protein